MPYKHQSESFRNINGERFNCWCDILELRHETELQLIKQSGAKYRTFTMPDDGVVRVFVREQDEQLVADYMEQSGLELL